MYLSSIQFSVTVWRNWFFIFGMQTFLQQVSYQSVKNEPTPVKYSLPRPDHDKDAVSHAVTSLWEGKTLSESFVHPGCTTKQIALINCRQGIENDRGMVRGWGIVGSRGERLIKHVRIRASLNTVDIYSTGQGKDNLSFSTAPWLEAK